MSAAKFRTPEYRKDARTTFGRMSQTTLRVTGLEPVLERANAANKAVLKSLIGNRVKYEDIIRQCGGNPEAIWREVKGAGGGEKPGAIPVIGMSLGNPNAYEDFPPNHTLMQCIRESMAEENDRKSCSYTASYGLPELLGYLKGVNLSNPSSVNNDPAKFADVKAIVTAGGSQAAHIGMAPLLLKPEHTVAVHDWIYIIHLGAAYYRDANVRSFELRNDGVPDPDSLGRLLHECGQNGAMVKCVVSTTIGNPIGSATPREVIVESMRVVEQQAEKDSRPIVMFYDTAYEAFRPDGIPLDPIEIAKDEGIEIPVIALETASKGHGLCGMRFGALRASWPSAYFSRLRSDYFESLDYSVQPTLGLVPTAIQRRVLSYLQKIEMNADALDADMQFLEQRRKKCNANLLHIANELKGIDGVYLARYYDHSGERRDIDPNTLTSFYIAFGFDKLTKYGAEFNQAHWLADFCVRNRLPVITCVPGAAFLPEERLSKHPALIRITALTNREDTDAFLKSVNAAAEYLRK